MNVTNHLKKMAETHKLAIDTNVCKRSRKRLKIYEDM